MSMNTSRRNPRLQEIETTLRDARAASRFDRGDTDAIARRLDELNCDGYGVSMKLRREMSCALHRLSNPVKFDDAPRALEF